MTRSVERQKYENQIYQSRKLELSKHNPYEMMSPRSYGKMILQRPLT